MIKMARIKGKVCPMFCCDICKEPLGADAMARWDPGEEEAVIEHVHKRTCDRRTDPDRRKYWEDLDVHIIYLKHNLLLSKKHWKDAEHRAAFLERL